MRNFSQSFKGRAFIIFKRICLEIGCILGGKVLKIYVRRKKLSGPTMWLRLWLNKRKFYFRSLKSQIRDHA